MIIVVGKSPYKSVTFFVFLFIFLAFDHFFFVIHIEVRKQHPPSREWSLVLFPRQHFQTISPIPSGDLLVDRGKTKGQFRDFPIPLRFLLCYSAVWEMRYYVMALLGICDVMQPIWPPCILNCTKAYPFLQKIQKDSNSRSWLVQYA